MDKEYIVKTKTGEEVTVLGRTPAEALGIFMKRGRFGVGAAWTFTRQPDGWIVCINTGLRTLERTYHKLREKQYSRGMR
jgi:hypothetical protein